MAAEGRHKRGVMAGRQSGHVVITHSSSSALEDSGGDPAAVPWMLPSPLPRGAAQASRSAVLAPRDLERLLAPACLGHSRKSKATGAQVGQPTLSVCPGHRPSSATTEKVPAVQDTAGHLLAQLF